MGARVDFKDAADDPKQGVDDELRDRMRRAKAVKERHGQAARFLRDLSGNDHDKARFAVSERNAPVNAHAKAVSPSAPRYHWSENGHTFSNESKSPPSPRQTNSRRYIIGGGLICALAILAITLWFHWRSDRSESPIQSNLETAEPRSVLQAAPTARARRPIANDEGSLCGQSRARPREIAAEEWRRYTCQPRDVSSWSECLPRHAYTRQSGRGCPRQDRCCPDIRGLQDSNEFNNGHAEVPSMTTQTHQGEAESDLLARDEAAAESETHELEGPPTIITDSPQATHDSEPAP